MWALGADALVDQGRRRLGQRLNRRAELRAEPCECCLVQLHRGRRLALPDGHVGEEKGAAGRGARLSRPTGGTRQIEAMAVLHFGFVRPLHRDDVSDGEALLGVVYYPGVNPAHQHKVGKLVWVLEELGPRDFLPACQEARSPGNTGVVACGDDVALNPNYGGRVSRPVGMKQPLPATGESASIAASSPEEFPGVGTDGSHLNAPARKTVVIRAGSKG